MAVRAIRGATSVREDSPSEIYEAVAEVLADLLKANDLEADDLISVLFTATPDITSAFPAAGARGMGLTDVPLMCAQEIGVPGAMPRVIRIMAHAETDLSRAQIHHPYLRGTEALRGDKKDDR